MKVLAIILSWVDLGAENYRVTVFDVGQGQSVLFECDNKHYLVDCGGESDKTAADTVAHSLLSRGITHLDGVFLTHFDTDHAGGLPLLLTSIPADTLYLPDIEDNGTIRRTLEKSNNQIYWINKYAVLEMESMRFTMIPGEHKTRDNERSLCILFQTENCDILITGDRSEIGEKALMEDIALPELELLIAGHHGSASSSCLVLVQIILTDTRLRMSFID